jgi:hypothetical protein
MLATAKIFCSHGSPLAVCCVLCVRACVRVCARGLQEKAQLAADNLSLSKLLLREPSSTQFEELRSRLDLYAAHITQLNSQVTFLQVD